MAQSEELNTGFDLGPAQSFSFDWLREQAQQSAAQPYRAPLIRHPEAVLERIDFDTYQQIRYRPEDALWAKGDGPYPVQFFHMGKLFQAPVRMHLVRDGMAREILYSPRLFTFGKAGFAADLPDDMGFAGFRVIHSSAQQRDWLAFLGAAYFRSAGELDQYGLSARGVAIGTGLPTPEEFPYFVSFWLEAAADPKALAN